MEGISFESSYLYPLRSFHFRGAFPGRKRHLSPLATKDPSPLVVLRPSTRAGQRVAMAECNPQVADLQHAIGEVDRSVFVLTTFKVSWFLRWHGTSRGRGMCSFSQQFVYVRFSTPVQQGYPSSAKPSITVLLCPPKGSHKKLRCDQHSHTPLRHRSSQRPQKLTALTVPQRYPD